MSLLKNQSRFCINKPVFKVVFRIPSPYIALIICVTSAITMIVTLLLSSISSHAKTLTYPADPLPEAAISIASSHTDGITLNTSISTGGYDSATDSIFVSTTSAKGYNLKFSVNNSTDNTLKSSQNISINPLVSNNSILADNTWGYSLNNLNNIATDRFNIVPTDLNPAILRSTTEATTFKNLSDSTNNDPADEVEILYGTKTAHTLPADTYSNTITYTATANPVPPPTITSVSPNFGPIEGGTSITITGTNFDSLTSLTITNAACQNIKITSATTATCSTPARNLIGPVDVKVITQGGNATLTNGFTYKEEFRFTIDTRMTDTIDTDASHYNGTATSFNIPVSGQYTWTYRAYNWIVNCGGGQTDFIISGTASANNTGITCNYATPGEYQITIKPNGTIADGWFDAFGFRNNTNGANAQSNKNMLKSIDTDFTPKMRRLASTSFNYTFYGAKNATNIPETLFTKLYTKGAVTSMQHTFRGVFYNYGYNSTSLTIPAGLFAGINTTKVSNWEFAFDTAFQGCAYNSKNATIPTGLFNSINTSSGTLFRYAFKSSFQDYGRKSPVATLPAGLFDGVNTSNAATGSTVEYMFQQTFYYYANESLANDTIPAGLFKNINTTSVSNFNRMFQLTFAYYAHKSTQANIPSGLFSGINTSNGTNLELMFGNTFDAYGYNSTVLSIPSGLFDNIYTSNATNLIDTFRQTFNTCGRASTIATIPNNLFTNIDTSSTGANLTRMFYSTFSDYGKLNTKTDGTPNTDINNIWGSANLTGVTASNVGGSNGVFYRTFAYMGSLIGNGQTFINNKLGGITPSSAAQTFLYTGLTDLTSLNTNWR